MNEKYISIGKMAEINHITIATLRLYDDMDLLKPIFVDPETSYRYYDIKQNARLDMIAYLKELDMSLSEIKKVLDTKDISLIESILSDKNETIHKEINRLKLKHEAVERSIKSIETFKLAPTCDVPLLQFIDRLYIWKRKCTSNFYEGTILDYENELCYLRDQLLDNDFSYIHTFNVGTSIRKENFIANKLISDNIFIFVDKDINKARNDCEVVEAGMFASIYVDKYENEEEAAKKLLKFCEDNDYEILDDYICEELTEFNVFNESNRNMFLRLQVRIGFKK